MCVGALNIAAISIASSNPSNQQRLTLSLPPLEKIARDPFKPGIPATLNAHRSIFTTPAAVMTAGSAEIRRALLIADDECQPGQFERYGGASC